LAIIALAWTSAQPFYPYFDVVKVDWPAELRQALRRANGDADEIEFRATLYRMMIALHDGHVSVTGPGSPSGSWPPVGWDWIEDRLTIVSVDKSIASRLRPGDVVLKLNGRDAGKLVEERMAGMTGATERFRRRIALTSLARGKKDSELELEVATDQEPSRKVKFTRSLAFQEFSDLMTEPRPAALSEIKPGVWYIDVERAEPKAFEEAVPKLANAKGIVFDVRGYPRIELEAQLRHIMDKPITSVPVYLPAILYPDRKYMNFARGNSTTMEPKEPRFHAKVIFLTDERAISAAETLLAMVAHYQLGVIMGSPTAGTNGNVRVVSLPAGYEVQFTGIKVVNYNGSPFHGHGVPPTFPVKRTQRGATEQRDEVLERALKYLSD
jgi:C-terminal processing protease CtpA/Prc